MTDLLGEFLGDLSLPELPDPVAWCEENIEFSPRVSPNQPGRFSTLLRPYMREPLSQFHPESGCTDLTLCWGSQCAKTTVAMMGMAYKLANDPSPTLVVMPTEALGRSWSQTRWIPLIEDNPALSAHMPENKDLMKSLEMQFARQTTTVVGSNSPSQLSSRPVQTLILDECCKFARASTDESSAMKLAEQRTKTFSRSLRVKMSTPTTAEHEFWLDFQAGDQRHFEVPCPECGGRFTFEHGQGENKTLCWDPEAKGKDGIWDKEKVRQTAHYRCPHCAFQIRDHHKPSMMLQGEWIARNPSAPYGRRSYHLNSFYSPDVQCSFGNLAVRFLESIDLFGLQDYNNGWMALPHQESTVNVKEEKIHALRCKEYRLGQIPPFLLEKFGYLVLTADPGQDQTHWVVSAVARDGEIAVVDCGTVLAPEDLLTLLKEKTYKGTGDSEWPIGFGIVDSGWQTDRIYDLCVRSRGKLWPSKGSVASFGTWSTSQVKTHRGLVLHTYVDYTLKLSLYLEKIEKRLAPLLHLPDDAPAALIHGLTGQQLLETRTPRGTTKYWKEIREDHFGDCVKLAVLSHWIAKTGGK